MDRESMRFKRRQEFVERRQKAWKKVLKNHPEGVTKSNLEQIKKEVHQEEKSDE